MSVKTLSEWFWGEILARPMEDCYKKTEFKICLRHAKILLKNDGLDEGAVKRTLLAMKDIGKDIGAMTMIRWEFMPSSGRSFYSLVSGDGTRPACYDAFGQILNRWV